MQENLKLFWEQFQKMPVTQRIAIIGGIVAVISALIVMTSFAGKTSYQLLYSNISGDDMVKIVAKLKEQKVEYKVSADNTTIYVPTGKVYDIRLTLASDGLPRGSGVGFELFNETKLGATEFVQKVNYQRALTGELTRTIMQFQEVEAARVHLSLPEESLFIEDKEVPTASVILRLLPGYRLKDRQVQGIVNLVSSAVVGLHPEDITVVDNHGNILAGGKEHDADSKMANNQMEYKSNFERKEEKRVTSMLERAVGIGRAVVRINAEMDFKKQEISEEVYDPQSQVARSESTTEDSSVGAVAASGVPGVVTNIPGAAKANQDVAKPAESSSSNTVTNYEINKTVKRTVLPVGKVTRISIAVMVDGKYQVDEDGKSTYIPRTPEELETIKNIAKKIVGFDEKRGDTIEVANVPFDTSHLEKELSEADKFKTTEFWMNIGSYAAIGLLFLFLFQFVLKPLIQWVTGPVMIEEEEPHKTVEEMELEDEEPEEFKIEERVDYRHIAQEITKNDPEKVAEFVRGWIRDRPQ